jgi:SUKH-4 immunity protein
MRIVLSANASDPVIGREYIDNDPEGEFVARPDGAIAYRHPAVGELFANVSGDTFVACVHAWERYVARVAPLTDEREQLPVVEELRRALEAQDGLRPESFWATILEQAEHGHL